MKVVFDTNVILDVFLIRNPFFITSSQAMGFAEQGKIEGWIGATTVTTIFYLLEKKSSSQISARQVKKLLQIFNVANIHRAVLEDALESGFKDFEDAVLYQVAIHNKLDAILTRNRKDFTSSSIPAYDPKEFLAILESLK
tara:strand:- start:26738 stop:27157 length:420 start_codon:yes stop_codon:yes gene_type:complete